MPETFRYRRKVEFRDTDAAGIVHFSVYFNYMENAEHALLRAAGTSVCAADDSGAISWPRVSAQCDFAGALKFEDEIEIEVRVARLGNKSVTFSFQFLCDSRRVARGEVTAVCCRVPEPGKLESIPIPNAIREQLQPYAEVQ
jgi:acyl-CoA thioester hydrolase